MQKGPASLVIVAAFTAFTPVVTAAPVTPVIISPAIVAAIVSPAVVVSASASAALASTASSFAASALTACALTACAGFVVAITALGYVVILDAVRAAEQPQDPIRHIAVIFHLVIGLLVFLGEGFATHDEQAWRGSKKRACDDSCNSLQANFARIHRGSDRKPIAARGAAKTRS
ncbi:hypothetical protein [Dongia deserti]|uniref:hypothetical protein n=1 Tax=Dongia deserti TaxID=2268030 RepID=UPI000E64BEF9|nr:hypothetical protein [Dongia deserti]